MDLITKMNEQHMIVRVTGEMSAPLKETFVVSREVTAQQIWQLKTYRSIMDSGDPLLSLCNCEL